MSAVSRRGRPRRTWGQRLVLLTGATLFVVLVAGAATIGYSRWKLDQIDTYDNLSLVQPASGAAENYLIVGSDSRAVIDEDSADAGAFLDGGAPGGQRSDTLLIARVDPSTARIDLLSLPRDLWVPIAGTGARERINTAYSEGRQQLIDTIEADFGIPINHYVEVDFVGFTSLVESIGGVPMWFDTAMRDLRSGLFVNGEGCVNLDGSQALALARSRELQYLEEGEWVSDPTGDLGRISRQQVLVLKAMERAVDIDITDPGKFDRVLDVGVSSVSIDEGITFDDMAGLAMRFSEMDEDTLVTHSLPVLPYTTYGGADVLAVNDAAAEPVLDIFRGQPATGLLPADVPVRVLNASGMDGHAASVAEALGYLGYSVVDVDGLGGIPLAASQVRYHPDDRQAADQVAAHLPPTAERVADDELDPGTVVVVTGVDLTAVSEAALAVTDLGPERVAADDDELPPTTTTTAGDADAGPDGSDPDVDPTPDHEESDPTTVGRTPGTAPEGLTCR
ncbi:MAG: LCP family protein [Actinomycetota bacterium]